MMRVRGTVTRWYVGKVIKHPRSEAWIIIHAYDGQTLTFRYEDDRTNTLYSITL